MSERCKEKVQGSKEHFVQNVKGEKEGGKWKTARTPSETYIH